MSIQVVTGYLCGTKSVCKHMTVMKDKSGGRGSLNQGTI